MQVLHSAGWHRSVPSFPLKEQFEVCTYGIPDSRWTSEGWLMTASSLLLPRVKKVWWRRRWEGAEGLGWISLEEETQSSSSSALLGWGGGPSWWHTAVSPEEMLRYRVMVYVLSLFKLVIILPLHPGFSLPKGKASWNHLWCPQWRQLVPVPQASDLPDLWEASRWREVRDNINRNFWCPKGKLFFMNISINIHTLQGFFDANSMHLTPCNQMQSRLPFLFFPIQTHIVISRYWVVLSINWAHGLTTASLSFSLLSTIPGCSVRVSTDSFLLIFPYPSFQCPSPSRGLSSSQHNLQKCFCESLFLFPSILPVQPHFKPAGDILLFLD